MIYFCEIYLKIAYLIQLQENARSAFIVAVRVFFRALSPMLHVDVADFASCRRFPVVADHPLLRAICRGWSFLVL